MNKTEQLTLPPINTFSHSQQEFTSEELRKLHSGNRILKLIEKAELKNVSKQSIISFLKNKGITETKIVEIYLQYYQQNDLYEITFHQRPLGFCVIKGNNNKNATISTIEHDENIAKGMQIGSYIYEINGKRVYNTNYKQILNEISQQKTPFNVIFKQNPMCTHESSISSSDYQWDCSPFYQTNENLLCISPSVSPLIGSDVYMTPSDYEYDNDELNTFELTHSYTFGNKYIQKELKKDKLIKNDINEILLIGCNNSGKNTIMKQLKKIYSNGYNDKEKIKFISYIHILIIKQMKLVLNIKDKNFKLSNKILKAKQYLNTININKQFILNIKICVAIKYIWNQKIIKNMYEKYKYINQNININISYFWDEIDRICKHDYIPTEYDIVRAPNKPTRIIEEKYTLNNNRFNVINIGGQRSNWKKWIECFSNVNIVIFVLSLECYNYNITNYAELIMNYYIDKHYSNNNICYDIQCIILKYCIQLGIGNKNAMDEQLKFWKQIINHKSLINTQMVLCLNKFDLFYKKISKIPITICPTLKSYWGSTNNVDSCVEYIRDKFLFMDNSTRRYIDVWFMDSLDYKSIQRNFNKRIHKLLK